MKKSVLIFISALAILSCNDKAEQTLIQGKVERDELAVVGKVAGRIQKIFVENGDFVKSGDTLAILDIPEVDAKKIQAEGALKSASAQYDMSVHGATSNQLAQLNAKKAALTEQYEFAKKSLDRVDRMVKDSLIPQQQYDEVYAKYQGAKAQIAAVNAEIADVRNGVRMEQQTMALGQKDRAEGALQEAKVADKERYIIAPQDMIIETITLKTGELALPGYTLFKGSLSESVSFRFTLPESQLSEIKKGQELQVQILYQNKTAAAVVQNIKQIGSYANIATAYPDYEMQDALYEIILRPKQPKEFDDVVTKATVTLDLSNK